METTAGVRSSLKPRGVSAVNFHEDAVPVQSCGGVNYAGVVTMAVGMPPSVGLKTAITVYPPKFLKKG